MSSSLYAIYGASGFGREVMPLAVDFLKQNDLLKDNLFFIDDAMAGSEVNGFPVLSYGQFIDHSAADKFISFAIADSTSVDYGNNKKANDLNVKSGQKKTVH